MADFKLSGSGSISCPLSTDELSKRIHEAIKKQLPADELRRLLSLRSDSVNFPDQQGRSPVHTAVVWNRVLLLDVLLKYGADPNRAASRQEHRWRPLHFSASHGHKECLRVLLEHGADIHARDEEGYTPYQRATHKSFRVCMGLLHEEEKKQRRDFEKAQEKIGQEMQAACTAGNLEKLLQLKEKYRGKWLMCFPNDGKTLLFRASEAGHEKIVTHLIANFAAPGLPCTFAPRATPLHAACQNGHAKVVGWLLQAFPNMISEVTDDKRSPLHLAVEFLHHTTVQLLLSHATELGLLDTILTQPDQLGRLALHLAAERGDLPLVALLCGEKCDFNSGMDLVSVNVDKTMGDQRSSLINHFSSRGGYQPIHCACINGSCEVVKWLIQHGAKVNVLAERVGRLSPLLLAVDGGHVDLIDLLLKHGATDGRGDALRAAIATDKFGPVVKRLLMCDVKEDQSEVYSLTQAQMTQTEQTQRHVPLPLEANWSEKGLEEVQSKWLTGAQTEYAQPPSEVAGKLLLESNLTAITTVGLCGNKLTTLPPELLCMNSLKTLDVSNNQITNLPAVGVDGQSLVQIKLSHNKLTSVPPIFFALRELVELDLSHNFIRELPGEMWWGRRLRRLLATDNEIEDLPVKSATEVLRQPRHRAVSMTHVSTDSQESEGVGSSTGEPSSEGSSVGGSSLTPTQHQPAGNFCSVGVFSRRDLLRDVQHEQTFDGIDTSKHRSLRMLELQHNRITGLPVELPCLAPLLMKLNVAHNKISSVTFPRGFPSLIKQLDISHNKIRQLQASRHCDDFPCCRQKDTTEDGAQPNQGELCQHRRHTSLRKLTNLNLSDNKMIAFDVNFQVEFMAVDTFMVVPQQAASLPRSKDAGVRIGAGLADVVDDEDEVTCPMLQGLVLSNNCLRFVPPCVSQLRSLTSLKLSNNREIIKLPNELGNLTDLFELKFDGLDLVDPAPDFLEKKPVKEIITFLRCRLKKAEPYRRLKLMLVGLQNKGKTTVLKTLRLHSVSQSARDGEAELLQKNFWEREVAMKSRKKSNVDMSTVGVAVSDWEYAPKKMFKAQQPVITFMTWDFGGQREYYATHQYFLSRRALYLLLWDTREMEEGVESLHSWLINIQARAPFANVIVVGSFYDKLTQDQKNRIPQMKRRITELYGSDEQHRTGYPVIKGVFVVNAQADNQQMKELRYFIYKTAADLEVGDGTRRAHKAPKLMEDQVPSSYMELGRRVREEAINYRKSRSAPLVNAKSFREKFMDENSGFNDNEELDHAVKFLHDNGILLHYDDPSLADLYFLDPQWLCDMLAHVVTVRSVCSFTVNGVLEFSKFPQIFKSTEFPHRLHKQYEHLLSKFEVAIRLDEERLLIPSLLPEERPDGLLTLKECKTRLMHRFICLPYAPSGFWARLISRILSDNLIAKAGKELTDILGKGQSPSKWYHWRTGIQLQCGENILLSVTEETSVPVLPHPKVGTSSQQSTATWFVGDETLLSEAVVDQGQMQRVKMLLRQREGYWIPLAVDCGVAVSTVRCAPVADGEQQRNADGHTAQSLSSNMMSHIISHIDALVEDWFTGICDVAKLSPCPACVAGAPHSNSPELQQRLQVLQKQKRFNLPSSDCALVVAGCAWDWDDLVMQTRSTTGELSVACFLHDEQLLSDVAPDVMFFDLPPHLLVAPGQIRPVEKLGEGAFGSIYRGFLYPEDGSGGQEVAIKSLLNDAAGERLFRDNDLAQEDDTDQDSGLAPSDHDVQTLNVGKAHRDTRRELLVLSALSHPHVVPLYGVCLRPLCFLMQLATTGSLDRDLKVYREAGHQLAYSTAWAVAVQVASALEYLHGRDVVYCDLKAENVLVFKFPKPYNMVGIGDNFVDALTALQPGGAAQQYKQALVAMTTDMEVQPLCDVLIKLSDYGISRFAVADSVRGYAGTPGYMAPEVISYSGTETYTSKVDIFSYAMVLFELITLRRPMSNATPQEIVRHYQLGKRPQPSVRDMSTSIQLRELMHWCWQQTAPQRPNARKVIDSLLSPKHIRLVHGFVLTEKLPVTAAAVRPIQTPASTSQQTSVSEGRGRGGQTFGGELWLCCGDDHSGHVKVMDYTGTNSSWETVYTCSCSILSVCLVESIAWLGTEDGGLVLIDAINRTFMVRRELPVKKAIMQILHIKSLKRVLVAQANGSVTAFPEVLPLERLPTTASTMVSPVISQLSKKSQGQSERSELTSTTVPDDEVLDDEVHKVQPTHRVELEPVCSYLPHREVISCMVEVPSVDFSSGGTSEVWCGHSEGKVVILDSKTLKEQASVKVSSEDRPRQRLAHLVVSYLVYSPVKRDEENSSQPSTTVWGSVHNSWLVNCWRVRDRKLVDTLNCAKELGISKRNEYSCQVTALHCHESQLYVGTRNGVVLVIALGNRSLTRLLTSYDVHCGKISCFLSMPLPHQPNALPPRSLVASCGGGFRSYVEDLDDSKRAAADSHILVWEAGWT